MFNRAFFLAAGVLLIGPDQPRYQTQDPTGLLRGARSLQCVFPSGGSEVLTDSSPRYQPAKGTDGVFDNIDRTKGTARVIGTAGAGDAQVIAGPETLTFIELSPLGYPQVTVVFARFRPRTTELLAADSRHAVVTGRVLVEQYYGSCRVLQ